MSESTIAAISTPPGTGGISIVRMSGDKSFDILSEIFRPASGRPLDRLKDKRLMHYGFIMDGKEEVDEVMVCYFPKPSTYTREDIVEINCHGSYISAKKILSLLLDRGAVLAEGGEFTKRAFLNGRIDLSQAEAVLDIINSSTDLSQKQGLDQLNGSVREAIEDIRSDLLEALSRLEYSINFTEDGEDLPPDEILSYMDGAYKKIEDLLKTASSGKLIRDGINTTIVGKPNVGKSSLLNRLLRENRAIVTDIPGTTRDSISEYATVGDLTLKINDTAGIRETEDLVEKIGVDRSIDLLAKADLVLAIFDISRPFDREDEKILSLIKDRRAIILLNKIDLPQAFDRSKLPVDFPIIESSMKDESSIRKLEEKIGEIFDTESLEREPVVITNVRHERLLTSAKDKLASSIKDLRAGVPLDCIEVDLRSSYQDLGLIIGEAVSDEIMDKVFKEFCVGK